MIDGELDKLDALIRLFFISVPLEPRTDLLRSPITVSFKIFHQNQHGWSMRSNERVLHAFRPQPNYAVWLAVSSRFAPTESMMDPLYWLLLVTVLSDIVTFPYTKVEESFNLQAIHDILIHGSNLSRYDHQEFPGPVPRTFIGALAISAMCWPLALLMQLLDMPKIVLQYLVRGALGFWSVMCFDSYRQAVSRRYGLMVSNLLLLACTVQFHLPFYMSRTLPNSIAFTLVMLAMASWLEKDMWGFVSKAGFSILVFRSELVLLFGPFLLISLLRDRTSLFHLAASIMITGVVSLAATILVDSMFWGRWLWPEGEVFWFNTVLNKSTLWGTQPLLWYFYSALPRAMLSFLIVLPLGFLPGGARDLGAGSMMFILLYSLLPHKELRFILYAIPLLNTVSATGLALLWNAAVSRPMRFLYHLLMLGLVISSAVASATMRFVSSYNYPGGEAFHLIQVADQLKPAEDVVKVHIDAATAQTGVSRFGELHPHWMYSKKEGELTTKDLFSFDLLLRSQPCVDQEYNHTHILVAIIKGLRQVSFQFSYPFVVVELEDHICILQRRPAVHVEMVQRVSPHTQSS